jgi:hypothetical protein
VKFFSLRQIFIADTHILIIFMVHKLSKFLADSLCDTTYRIDYGVRWRSNGKKEKVMAKTYFLDLSPTPFSIMSPI